jgi:hypothetical protein
MKTLFIIGMQKSGTSLFNRMLMKQDFVCNPFLPEGKFFWGDNPPFSPIEKPCGELYQNHNGERGHFLDEGDFRQKDKALLFKRIEEAGVKEAILMNKNPYNSVRIKWLKKVLPESTIVAVYRNPVANIYSLLKRYDKNNTQGVMPEQGWWGIKPENWMKMISEDKVLQCSLQWNAVNSDILSNINNIDLLINYENLCNYPTKVIKKTIDGFHIKASIEEFSVLKNMNDEYLNGSRLQSKNKELRQNSGFDLTNLKEKIEFPPLSDLETKQIQSLTKGVWLRLLESNKNYSNH